MLCQALNLRSWANYVLKTDVTHACLFTNVRTHAQHIQSPRPVENLTGVGQCS